MAKPKLREYRDIVTQPDGSRGFLVTAQVTDPGSGTEAIPFVEVFVLTISDPLDPKTDVLARVASPLEVRRAATGDVYVRLDPSYLQTFGSDPFARVANVAEFTQLARDRDTALRRGQTEYLSSSVSFLYTDAVTATAAFRVIVDRVSQLVSDWVSYRDGFLPSPPPFQDYELPQVSIGVEAELVAAYRTARQARIDAQAARDAAQTARDACQASCRCTQEKLQLVAADVAFLRTALDHAATIAETATGALVLTGGTTLTPPGTYTVSVTQTTNCRSFVTGADPRSFQTMLNQKTAQLAALQAAAAACAAQCAQLQDTLLAAQATLTQAQAAEAAALANVTAVCPTFDPATA